jgi:hypothetical protein
MAEAAAAAAAGGVEAVHGWHSPDDANETKQSHPCLIDDHASSVVPSFSSFKKRASQIPLVAISSSPVRRKPVQDRAVSFPYIASCPFQPRHASLQTRPHSVSVDDLLLLQQETALTDVNTTTTTTTTAAATPTPPRASEQSHQASVVSKYVWSR